MIPISKPYIGPEERQGVLEVLDSGMVAQGQRVRRLEEAFASLSGVRFAVATSSGTTALHTALLAHDIGSGDEVITTPFTFIASANSILFTGAKPVFADIETTTFNIDPKQVAARITSRTKAIMPVHLYGQLCNMVALETIAQEHGLIIIEDACQAVGATYRGRKAGSFGTGVFSLYATKNIMSAEGGMITTDDEEIAERCRLIRNHGMRTRYYYDFLAYNYRMTDLHAAIGLAQIGRVHEFNEKRRSNAAYLNEGIHSVVTPREHRDCQHVWHQYTVQVDGGRDRDEAVRHLNEAGVGTGIFYPVPAHQHTYMREIVGDVHLPVAEQLATEVISLPVHPQLSQNDLEVIVAKVNEL